MNKNILRTILLNFNISNNFTFFFSQAIQIKKHPIYCSSFFSCIV